MLTGKQRSYLKSLANTMKPLAQLGKEGVTESFIAEINQLLEKHELIKINVLDASLRGAKEAANELCEALDAEFVQAIGNKCSIYRQSRENPTLEIPGADNTRVFKNRMKKLQIEREKEKRLAKNKSTGKRIRRTVKKKSK